MKYLSFRQAQRCEDALEPVCKCRCGGALHGAKRGVQFEMLPLDDFHFVPSKEMKKAMKRGEAELKNARRLNALMEAYNPSTRPTNDEGK